MTDREPADRVDLAYSDSQFCSQVFATLAERTYGVFRDRDPQLADIVVREYISLSSRLEETGLQEGCSARNILTTRKLANYLVTEEGVLSDENLSKALYAFEHFTYPLGPEREHDARRRRHIVSVLKQLKTSKSLRQGLLTISAPHNNVITDQIIRDTLQVELKTSVTDALARRAALSAWLCMLRQNVGSCFATAPAIIVHDEQPLQFLSDLHELLSTGRLHRTFGGVEYSAPMSHTWGAGDLRKPFSLNLDQQDVRPIWRSPGFLAALRSVDLASEEREQSLLDAEALVRGLLKNWPSKRPYVLTFVEDLLRRLLLNKLDLTEEDIREYELRPKPMMATGIISVGVSSQPAGKGGRCATFFADLDCACKAFKALTENALLRSWEFTVASFAETKPSFTTWNFYSSLGLDAKEGGGIGNKLYEILDQKLQHANTQVHEHQEEYEIQYQQIKYLEGRMKRASTEQEQRFLKAEYQTRVNEFHTIEVLRNRAHVKAQRYANLFNVIIDEFLELFPKYFQEVYDADLHEGDVDLYDDRPAGFRLLFKHGRSNTALWTRIYSPGDYADAIASFFTMAEHQISNSEWVEGIEDDLGEIITAVVTYVKTPEFLETALYRMAVAHKGRLPRDPLNHLDLVEKKPWAYTSGGTMNTLVANYFRTQEKPSEASRWVENEMELLVFLLDQVKKMPDDLVDEYTHPPGKSLLIHSPTHAFLFRPQRQAFRRAIETKEFTYTWVRDHLVQPAIDFVNNLYLDRDLMTVLVETLEEERIPKDYKAWYRELFYRLPGKLRVTEFREHLWKEISSYHKLRRYGQPVITENEIDSFLYRHLPVTYGRDIGHRLETVIRDLPDLTSTQRQAALDVAEKLTARDREPLGVTANQLRQLVIAILSYVEGSHSPYPRHKQVVQVTQNHKFAYPEPIIFADTNWVTDFFAFVVSPATATLELWRVDETGASGSPMSEWKQWVDGSKRSPDWGIYINPLEYRT